MTASELKSLPVIGFLSVVHAADTGFCGGYLLVGGSARPVEFHCTAPVRPNRAQQILYGPTLWQYLYGELIGKTLYDKAKIEPLAVCTDQVAALSLRELVAAPVMWVDTSEGQVNAQSGDDAQSATPGYSAPLSRFSLGRFSVAVAASHESDRQRIIERMGAWAERFDLVEPFTRVRAAVEEVRHTFAASRVEQRDAA
jgi:hypothetical protein